MSLLSVRSFRKLLTELRGCDCFSFQTNVPKLLKLLVNFIGKMTRLLFARLSLWITFLQFTVGNLDEFLNYYETLHHDNFRHQIKRRDLYTKNPIERIVEFESHGRHFKLMLHKNTSVLSSHFKVSVVDERERRSAEVVDPAIYKGYLADQPTTSSVRAYWDDDQHFTASISTESDIFVVEPSWRHLPESPDYTLISYKGSDLKQNEKSDKLCGVSNNSAYHGKASDADKMLDDEPNLLNKDRRKRSTRFPCPQSLKKTCEVLLVADYRFYREVGKSDVAKTYNYMIFVVDEVDHLFRGHVFGDCGSGFGVAVKNILVHTHPSRESDHYNYPMQWNDSQKLLESFSKGTKDYQYSDFCLVHLFTALPFSSLVLGVSYGAEPSAGFTGGVCSGSKSGNTGWTTFLDRNRKRVLGMQAMLVVAHEFGHGWGSHHDAENSSKKCIPSYREGGQYLMYVNSVTGRQPNNRRFSNCSIAAIRDVLVHKTGICFTEEGKSRTLCGNYIKEKGEQCDEGPGPHQICCNSNCHLVPGAECSNFNDVCCELCKIANTSKVCKEASVETCEEKTYCDGNSSSCPKPSAMADGMQCEKQGVCSNKTCISVCVYNNKTQCVCDSVELSCRICCRDSMSENNTCKPYRLSNETTDFGNVSDNTPCPLGMCSEGVCVKVTDVTIQRTWKIIEIKSFSQFVKFMKDNIVGTVIILSLLFWIPASCAVSRIDRKRANRDLQGINWLHITNNLLVPAQEQNSTKIKKTVGTLERTSCTRKAGRQYKH